MLVLPSASRLFPLSLPSMRDGGAAGASVVGQDERMVARMAREETLNEQAEHLLRRLWLWEKEGQGAEVFAEPEEVLDPAMAALRQQGWVEEREGTVRLTPEGERMAASVIRRHRLAERLLADVLQVSPASMIASVCDFEHLLRLEVEQRVCTLLGHPTTCPHGFPIPPGPCCLEARRSDLRLVVPLSEMRPQEKGIVAYLAATQQQDLQKLTALGVLPGQKVRLLRRFPAYVFEMGHSQYAVDTELARHIYVRLED